MNFSREFEWSHNHKYGNCYTFNIGLKRAQSPMGKSENNWFMTLGASDTNDDKAVGVKQSNMIEDSYGLILLLNTDSFHYLPVSNENGWRVVSKFLFQYKKNEQLNLHIDNRKQFTIRQKCHSQKKMATMLNQARRQGSAFGKKSITDWAKSTTYCTRPSIAIALMS